eukprot:SAG31_NODE_793_length_12044_cov_12.886229_9_plen_161_part_00
MSVTLQESLQAGAAASGGAIGGLGGGSQAAMVTKGLPLFRYTIPKLIWRSEFRGACSCRQAFIKIKSGYRREQVEEYVIRWRDLLMSNAFDINPYLVEDDLVLMHTEANHRIGSATAMLLIVKNSFLEKVSDRSWLLFWRCRMQASSKHLSLIRAFRMAS